MKSAIEMLCIIIIIIRIVYGRKKNALKIQFKEYSNEDLYMIWTHLDLDLLS